MGPMALWRVRFLALVFREKFEGSAGAAESLLLWRGEE